MHTLASGVVPSLTSLNPCTRVVALYSEKNSISLYRLNGELVWSVAARKQTSAKSLVWSPDGANIAVIYADGIYQILHESDGKVAQVVANQNASTLEWQSRRSDASQTPFELSGPTQPLANNLVAAVGSRRGELKVNLDGVLSLGALALDGSPAQQIECVDGDFWVLTVSHLHKIEAEYLRTHTKAQINDLVVKPARTQKTLEQMVMYSSKLASEHTTFEAAISQFFNLESPTISLYSMIIGGVPDAKTAAWVEDMHESGFRRWHKACTHYYAQVEQLSLTLVGLSERLVVYLAELDDVVTSECPRQIVEALYELLHKLQTQRKLYLSFAVALQHIYCTHLDRALKVIDEDTVKSGDWVDASVFVKDTLANPRVLEGPAEIRKLKVELDESLSDIKVKLTSQFKVAETLKIQGEARNFVMVGAVPYVLAWDGGLWLQNGAHRRLVEGQESHAQDPPVDAFFYQKQIVVLRAHALQILDLDLNPVDELDFSFKAAGCTIANGEAVVVSADGLHFDVLNLK